MDFGLAADIANHWIPAFTGMTDSGWRHGNYEGRSSGQIAPLIRTVIPAQAGIRNGSADRSARAFLEMTRQGEKKWQWL